MKKINKILSLIIVLAIMSFSFSCSGSANSKNSPPNLSFSEIDFKVHLLSAINEDEKLILELLDEVTGISLNPERFYMATTDGINFSVRLPLSDGSVIRYRYVKSGQENIIEKDISGKQIQYRLFKIEDATSVNDIAFNWDQTPVNVKTGELSGYIYDSKTESPLSEIMVVINGLQAFTSVDGFYKFNNIPLGEYHLTTLHMDGKYEVFQQNAIIAENSITPASFGLNPAKNVNVTFLVNLPEETNPKASVRFLGNLFSLGNSFSETSQGDCVIASRSPILKLRNDGRLELTLSLPAGTDLRYKYSLGNGFINAEHDTENKFITRQIIVPNKDTTISDDIATWFSIGSNPVNFIVTVPENTPKQDSISLQLNPYTWLDPIPMWKSESNKWIYSIYSPLEYLNSSEYRFCRNNQCGVADDAVTAGDNSPGYVLSLQDNRPLTINYQINDWFGLQQYNYAIQPVSFPAETSIIVKGYQFDVNYDPNWVTYLENSFINMGVSGANWLFFSPTWTFSTEINSQASLFPGNDITSEEILLIKDKASNAGMGLSLYPRINSNMSVNNYWLSTNLSYNWWQNWFDQYERFILNYVDFSEAHGISSIVIGGSDVSAAFPNGKLPNGSFSNTPYNFQDRWAQLIEKIRSRFKGQIGFALPYSIEEENSPAFLSAVDFIYLEFNEPLSSINEPTVDEMTNKLNQTYDENIYQLYATYQRPIIISLNYHSVDGTASKCINSNSDCTIITDNSIDIPEQADVYQAVLKASISKPWIVGLVSNGYNPSVAVADKSASINGKPAGQVLSYYFNNLN